MNPGLLLARYSQIGFLTLGGGLDKDSGKTVSQLLQMRMKQRDFSNLSAEECLKALLGLLSSNADSSGNSSSMKNLLNRGTRLEMALVGQEASRFKRIPFKTLQLTES